MTIFLSLGLFIVVYLGLVYLVFHLRKNSAIVPLVLAYPAFICLESLLLNVLSMFHAVTSQWLIGAHLLFCLGVVIHMGANRRVAGNLWFRLSSRVRQLFRTASPPFILMLPLLFIICLTAFLYVPNNYDSMTYHLARVAHWIQNQSVGYYLTHIARQNQMGPGAEYLILFFQIISGSDRLANAVQFFSYLLIPIGLYYLMRVIRIDRKTIPWIIVLCMTTPMAVLQASSTQNDLVDSLLALSIILIGARLLVGNAMRMERNDIILAAVCCSAGYLVKPISLIVIFPIIVAGCLLQFKKMFHLLRSPRGYYGLLASLILIAIICGPDIVRKVGEGGFSRSEVYPLLGGWDAARFYNPITLLAPNFPYSTVFNEFIRDLAIPVQSFNRNIYFVHEDFIGNPVQLLLLFIPALLCRCLFAVWAYFRFEKTIDPAAVCPVAACFLVYLCLDCQKSGLDNPFAAPALFSAAIQPGLVFFPLDKSGQHVSEIFHAHCRRLVFLFLRNEDCLAESDTATGNQVFLGRRANRLRKLLPRYQQDKGAQ